MSSSPPLPVSTASDERSIWRDTDQYKFRKHIIDLQQACNNIPEDPKLHVPEDWHGRRPPSNDDGRVLPFEVEERLSNDFAFLVANQKDAGTVSAVALEEIVEPPGLIARLAANGGVQEGVVNALQAIFSILEKCGKRQLHRTVCRDLIFDEVVALNRNRINGRLQSKHWIMPGYLGAAQLEQLHQSLQAFAQRAVPIARAVGAASLQRNIDDLCLKYQSVDSSIKDTDEELQSIKAAVKQSHGFCSTPDGMRIEETIASYGLDPGIALQNKHIRQVDKIGRYWGLCDDMASISRRYSNLFKSIRLEIVPRYRPFTPSVVFPNKAVPCHVHAEIQLVTFYGLHPEIVKIKPRVLGQNACQSQLLEYRHALAMINDQLQTSLATKRRNQWRRAYPLESWQALRSGFPTSPLPSSVGTLISRLNSPIASAVTSSTITPRARPIDPSPCPGYEADNSSTHNALGSLYSNAPSPRLPASSHLSSVRKPDLEGSCHAAMPTQQRENLSLSASSIASSELPVQRNFTAVSPIRSRIGNMSLTFETEGAVQGSVAIARILDRKTPMPANSIDVDALKPGEVKEFAREADGENVVLNLNHSQDQSTQITLRWL
ncbi:hypothetical protein HO133_003104 [Letharia lupina]|uniref:Uncharacterized protein n=1 Tax=Letharia lupina TaxID=560253 RepID=A0A8H6FA81_9LECA|nr:uncharacterized protein HO133_003104 [Letharia lupina]KAF6220671.1 hypothetical protein HO133_003104 [Letharia lupina]